VCSLEKKKKRKCSERSATKLLAERLESRELMSVNAWVDRGTLFIEADPGGGTVDVRSFGSSIRVDGPGDPMNFSPASISRIRFSGSSRQDVFTNYTAINSTIYGNARNGRLTGGSAADIIYAGAGNDVIQFGAGLVNYLYGGAGNDTLRGASVLNWLYGGDGNDSLSGGNLTDYLYGGNGHDTLHGGSGLDWLFGESGNDNLYGGPHLDTLNGGSGNDGLYGGRENDVLTGGTGSDRFLRHHWETGWWIFSSDHYGASITDMERQDADLLFEDSGAREFNTFLGESKYNAGRWTHANIEAVDRALEDLHHATGNDQLLERSNNGRIAFVRVGSLRSGPALNGVNNDEKIFLTDTGISASTVFHEIGHFWDESGEIRSNADFRAISDWRGSASPGYRVSGDGDWFYRNDATFARDYGRSNPREDFATTFAAYFLDTTGRSPGADDRIPQKAAYMRRLIGELS
jgi:hypothetical protein